MISETALPTASSLSVQAMVEILQPHPSFVSALPISDVATALEALSSALKQGANVEKVVSEATLRHLLKSAYESNVSRM